MRTEQTIFSGYIKPLRIKLKSSTDKLKLTMNTRFKFSNFKTSKNTFELLNSLPAIKIKGNRFYAEPKLKIDTHTKLEVFNTSEILTKQSKMLTSFFEERKKEILEEARLNYENFKR